MLRWRLLLGVLFIAALAGLIWLDAHAQRPGIWLLPLVLVIAAAATQELLALAAHRGLAPHASEVYAGNLLIVAASGISVWRPGEVAGAAWSLAATGLALLLVLAGEMWRFRQPGGVFQRLAIASLAILYIGVNLACLVQLRLAGSEEQGLLLVLALVAIVKCGDIGAYTVGRLIGRRKMAPYLSPGKTIEGGLGGIAASLLAAYFTLWSPLPTWMATPSPADRWWWPAVFGVVVGVAGMLGDLAESLLKRDAGQKDSSAWMPGFGGVLDLVDSVLIAAPVGYLVFLALQ